MGALLFFGALGTIVSGIIWTRRATKRRIARLSENKWN